MAVTPRELPQDVQEQQCSHASSWQTEISPATALLLQPSDTSGQGLLGAGTGFAPPMNGEHHSQAGGARRPAEKGRTRSHVTNREVPSAPGPGL